MKMEALLLKSRALPHREIAACVGGFRANTAHLFSHYLTGGICRVTRVHFYRPTRRSEPHRTTLEAYFTEHRHSSATQAAAAIEELMVSSVVRRNSHFYEETRSQRLKTYAIRLM